MSRISRPAMFMEIAHIVAKRATCFRLNVGAVITFHNRVISMGYNGVAPGAPHCQGNNCPGKDLCTLTTHAEINALDYIPAHASFPDVDMYCTDSPCPDCARAIIHDGRVSKFYFRTPYRVKEGLTILHDKGIHVFRILPSGTVVDWLTHVIVEE